MNLDSGVAMIWRGSNTSPAGSMPVYRYEKLCESYYGDKTVGVTRFWAAKAQDDRADLLIQIQRNSGISAATDRCQLSPYLDLDAAGMYKILQVQQVTDENGLPMTDLTLQRIEALDDE